MFKNLTYKKKNRLLLAAACLVAIIIYSFAVKKTIVAWQETADAEERLEQAVNINVRLGTLRKKLSQFEQNIDQQQMKNTNVSEELLEIVTNYCQANNAVLREFPSTVTWEQKDLLIETNTFVVEAGFSHLLKLVYLLEQQNELGKITSVNYQAKKNPITKRIVLTATVYLQNIKKNKHEK